MGGRSSRVVAVSRPGPCVGCIRTGAASRWHRRIRIAGKDKRDEGEGRLGLGKEVVRSLWAKKIRALQRAGRSSEACYRDFRPSFDAAGGRPLPGVNLGGASDS